MKPFNELYDGFRIPYTYKTQISQISNKLKENKIDRLNEFAGMKQKLELREIPKFVSDAKQENPQFIIQNTSFFKQAEHLGLLAKNASIELKPFLYHYAEISLYAFFCNTLFQYDGHNKHGLEIDWGSDYSTTKIIIHKQGTFARILDAYWILGYTTHFSLYASKSGVSKINDLPTSLLKEPKLSLEELLKIRTDLGSDSEGFYLDAVDFLLLFYASSLSRYKPAFWHEIVSGMKGNEITNFNKCFNRYEILFKRLVSCLEGLRKECDSSALYKMDSEFESGIYFPNF